MVHGRWPAPAREEVTPGHNCDESRPRVTAWLDSLLIKPPRWAGTAPATHPGGQISGTALLTTEAGWVTSHTRVRADTILGSQSQTSHYNTHSCVMLAGFVG